MLYSKVKTEMDKIGFEWNIDTEETLVDSINRSLRDLYSSRSITKTVTLAASGLQPIAYYKEINLPAGKVIEIPINGPAFSMKAHGILTYAVKDGTAVTAHGVVSPYEATVIREFMVHGGSVMIWGDYSISIYDLAVYDRVYTAKKEDIPIYGPTITFDLRKMYGDFMSFCSPARDRNGRAIDGCVLYDGKLEIDSSYKGAITLSYRRLPTQILYADIKTGKDKELDVPEEYTHIFHYLVAYYLWIESDEAKSKYYRSLYEDNLKRIDQKGYESLDYGYIDSNGWCK